MEKHVDFAFKAPYCTLNELTDQTTDIWIVCHGYGQLASNFIRRFDVLSPKTNFVVALQGLSKFYLPNRQDVGASWMTKEDRETELQNQAVYFDAVLTHALAGRKLENLNVNLFGFSQGVSMISRMAAHRQIVFDLMVLWVGGFPSELTARDFQYLPAGAKLKIVLGDQDQFYSQDKYQKEIDQMKKIIRLDPEIIHFSGKHEVQREVLKKLAISH